jgi:hypothetical protein
MSGTTALLAGTPSWCARGQFSPYPISAHTECRCQYNGNYVITKVWPR